jgi:Ca2+-binding RTX toxin-like protein
VWVLSDLTALPATIITPKWFLKNDSDPEGSVLYVTTVEGLPAGMTANYDVNGRLVGITGTTPVAGTYTLSYTVSDGTTSSTSSVVMKILDTTPNVDRFDVLLDGSDFSYVDLLSGGDTITGDLILNGNAGEDIFIGNNGDDTLNGGAGNDQLFGNENTDTLNGGEGSDLLDGGAGNDTLNGDLGMDVLTGGTGNDKFVFNTQLGATNVDTIADFDAGGNGNQSNDLVLLGSNIFAALGSSLDPSEFVINQSGAASGSIAQIIYNSGNGQLLYDADGAGGAAAVHFATIQNLAGSLDRSDFFFG